ncbi:MAG: Fur family transcriptional regulator, partial [Fidelibacterota bacterium]
QNLIENPNHRECEEIYLDLLQKGYVVSRATIYRTLDIAVKYGFARKMDIGEGKSLYETKLEANHHDHIVCTVCGKITEFLNDEIEKIQLEICNSNNSQLVRHTHQLFVICPECQKN